MRNVPLLPFLAYPFAKNWIAGKSILEAIAYSKVANSKGFDVILNYLGEEVETVKEAEDS